MIRLTCREVIARLADYDEAAIYLLTRARIVAHLALCPECRAYLETYRRVIALVGRSGRVPMPSPARHRLTRALLARLGRGDQ